MNVLIRKQANGLWVADYFGSSVLLGGKRYFETKKAIVEALAKIGIAQKPK